MRQLFRRITTISATCALAVSVAAAVAVAAEPTTGNILTGKLPTTNSTHLIGDGDTGFGPTDSNITKIIAGEENGSAENNGYASWDDVYLQYDFGEPRDTLHQPVPQWVCERAEHVQAHQGRSVLQRGLLRHERAVPAPPTSRKPPRPSSPRRPST